MAKNGKKSEGVRDEVALAGKELGEATTRFMDLAWAKAGGDLRIRESSKVVCTGPQLCILSLPAAHSLNQMYHWRRDCWGRGHAYKDRKVSNWQDEVQLALTEAKVIPFQGEGNIALYVLWIHGTAHKADVDNRMKALQDGLQARGKYGVYDNDARVSPLVVERRFVKGVHRMIVVAQVLGTAPPQ